jgi:hypothetical protein
MKVFNYPSDTQCANENVTKIATVTTITGARGSLHYNNLGELKNENVRIVEQSCHRYKESLKFGLLFIWGTILCVAYNGYACRLVQYF